MPHINRSAVVLQPKQPFLDWRNSLEIKEGRKPFTLEKLREDPKIYLVFGFKDRKHVEQDVLADYDLFFQDQLVGTITAENEWPKNRTVEMFKIWFDMDIYCWVDDTLDTDIIEED